MATDTEELAAWVEENPMKNGVTGAIYDTLKVLDAAALPPEGEASFNHLYSMYAKVRYDDFPTGKQNRWLGYIQGVAISLGAMTLEQAKSINRNWSLDAGAED